MGRKMADENLPLFGFPREINAKDIIGISGCAATQMLIQKYAIAVETRHILIAYLRAAYIRHAAADFKMKRFRFRRKLAAQFFDLVSAFAARCRLLPVFIGQQQT